MKFAGVEFPGLRVGPCAALCLLAGVLAGCGPDSKAGSATQVLAKVNGDEITVHQLNDRLSQIQIPPGLDANATRKQVLEALIDEQLLVQRAIADKLDRDPQVLQAIERTKRQILAQAEVERLAAARMDITAAETAKFYAGNPDLFEKRRIYIFRQFLLDTPKLDASVKSQMDEAKTPADVISILKVAGIKFRDQTEIRPAEMLPMGMLTRVARMTRGDILLQSEAGQVQLLQLVDAMVEPVDLERATPAIQAHLETSKKKETAVSLLKDMHQKAKIEYVGGIANTAPAPVPVVEAQAPAPAPAKESAAKSDDYIHKGISGLKK